MNPPRDKQDTQGMQDMAQPDRRGGYESYDGADAELEALLRAMPLRRPSSALDQGVLRDLRRARRPRDPRSLPPPLWAAAAAVAASIVLAFGLTVHWLSPGHRLNARQPGTLEQPAAGPGNQPVHPHPPAPLTPGPLQVAASTTGTTAPGATPARPQPLRVIRTLGGVADDGVVGTVNGVPVHRIRRATVQQVFVFEPGRGTYVTYSRPTEQVLLVAAPAF